MLKYKDVSGTVFKGPSALEIVRRMRATSWVVASKQQYMRDVARRLRTLGTKGINTTSSKTFIASLVKTGWLRKAR